MFMIYLETFMSFMLGKNNLNMRPESNWKKRLKIVKCYNVVMVIPSHSQGTMPLDSGSQEIQTS